MVDDIVFAVGVGPGSIKYLTKIVTEKIKECDIIVGYEYTLNTIKDLLPGKKVYKVTMKDQEETYQKIKKECRNQKILIPFTGDANFSESEVIDRLVEIFGNVEIIPGISSVQIAAAKAQIPLDKSKVITFHVTSSIEEKKIELQKALIDGFSLILIPRPWPSMPKKQFMPSDIALYLRKNGFNTKELLVYVFEKLCTDEEKVFKGTMKDLENKDFSDLSVMVIDQAVLDSYMNYKWQWSN